MGIKYLFLLIPTPVELSIEDPTYCVQDSGYKDFLTATSRNEASAFKGSESSSLSRLTSSNPSLFRFNITLLTMID